MTDKTEIVAKPTSEQYVRIFDLHVEVRRAVRTLDDAFPPYRAEDFEAIYARAQRLREQTTTLIEHLDQMRTPPSRPGGES